MIAHVVADDGLVGGRRIVAIGCVLSSLVLVVLDAAMVNVALPAIALSLRVAPEAAVRVVTAYQFAIVIALLPCAALGERLGYRRVFTAGVAVFVCASVACASAPSLSILVAARFIQGLGAAAVMALCVALLRFIVPERELGAAIGRNTLAVALASAAGPAVGAFVVSSASVSRLFAINLPVGVLVLIATRALPDGGVVSRSASSMIPLDLLRLRPFRISVIASVCSFTGQGAAMVALPFHLHHGLGQDTVRTGLSMTPWPLAVALVAPIAGRVLGRVSGASMCALGGALLALGLAGLALLPMRAWPFALVPCVALCGVGFGLFQVANNHNMFMSAPRTRSAAAGGLQGTARLTGQMIGASIMAGLFTATSLEVAPRIGLCVAAAFTALAGVVSTRRASAP